jgi:hypothetical protein
MIDDFVKAYVLLAFGIEAYIPGYVDAYYGPEEWRQKGLENGKQPLEELVENANQLAKDIPASSSLEIERKNGLTSQVKAMQTSLSLLQGKKILLADEAEALFGVRPEWVDESVFVEAHRVLDRLLPQGATLGERMVSHKKTLEVPVEQVRDLLPEVVQMLRKRTRARFPLPEEESFEVVFVHDKPWGGYNYFLGNGRSRIEINTDLPMRITSLLNLLAHEGYPGHHTELSIKENCLVKNKGWLEFSMIPLFSPYSLLSEGIAMRALDQLLTEEEQIAWEQEVLFPLAGLAQLNSRHEHAIQKASRPLNGVEGNASFLLHDRGVSPQQVADYLVHWGLSDEQEASKFLEFTQYGSYIFNYIVGRQMLDDLLDKKDNPDQWFIRLLSEPVTPAILRSWI